MFTPIQHSQPHSLLSLLVVATFLLLLSQQPSYQQEILPGDGQIVSSSVQPSSWQYFKFSVPPDHNFKLTVHEQNYKYCQLSSFVQRDTIPMESIDNHMYSSFSQQYQVIQHAQTSKSNTTWYLGVRSEFCYGYSENDSDLAAFSVTLQLIDRGLILSTSQIIMISALGSVSIGVFCLSIVAVLSILYIVHRRRVSRSTVQKTVDDEHSSTTHVIDVKVEPSVEEDLHEESLSYETLSSATEKTEDSK